MKSQGLLAKAISTVALSALLAAPLLSPPRVDAKPKKKPIDITKLAWPPAPEIARIKYVGEYYGPDIRGAKKQSILERLAGVEDRADHTALVKPYGVAVDSRGRIFVSDTMQAVVFVFDIEGKQLAYRGEKPPAALRKPTGMAVDDKDRLFVSDSEAHNVTAFGPEGDVLSVFGDKELGRPAGIVADSVLNRLYVADAKLRKVAVYDLTSLKFQRWIGKAPEEEVKPGEQDKLLYSPNSLALDPDGNLYVVDTFTNRVVVFDTDGEFVRQIGAIGQGAAHFMRPRGVAVDSDGHVYVTDAMAHLFQMLTPEGGALMPIGGFGNAPGRFQLPAAITIDRKNRIIVADQLNRRIQIFRYITDAEAAAQAGKRAGEPAAATPAKE